MKYKIKQLKEIKNDGYAFMPYSFAEKKGFDKDKDYQTVYEGDVIPNENGPIATLDDLFYTFNCNHPTDFRGHSLSVSDIVELDGKAYYCDSAGWEEID